MRNVKRLIAVIMAVIMLFSVVPTNVFAATGSKNLISTDKAVYELGEQFKITVHSYENSNDWVAVYNATSSTTPINGWYYVNHWYYPEKDGTKDANGWSCTFDSLGAGYYRAYLLKSDGYEVMDYVDFEIKSNSNLSLDKEVYHVGEAINVTATGSGADLVGLYRMYENHGSGGQTDVSKYWYYVAKNGHTSGSTYQINTAANIQDGHTHETLPAGEYKVHLFPNDSYDSTACKKFTIVDHTYNETQIAKKATFTDAGVIKTVCSCGAENGSTTAIPAVSDVTLEYTTVQFENGKTYTPAVTVKDSTGASVAVENYDVAYTDNDKPGMAKAIITLKGDKYEGSKELSFEINEAANICSFDTEAVKVKATFDTAGVIANKCVCGKFEEGSEKAIPAVSSVTLDTDTALTGGTPSVTVKDSADKALVKDTDYTVSYSDNGSVGTATATVTLKGEFYEGTKAVNYNVIPFTVNKTDLCYGEDLIVKSKDCGNSSCIGIYKDGEGYNPDDGGKHSIFWQYTSAFDAAGVCFSSNKGGLDPSQNNRSDTLRDGYLAPGSYKIVFFADGGYAANDKYTTKITVSDHNYSNVSVTSKATLEADGLITKTCKCDKTQTEAISKIAEVSIGSDEYPLVGDDVTPVVTVKDSKGNDLVKDTDYTVSYVNNDKVTDEAKVVVTFKGDYYEGTKEITFKIVENHTHDPYDKIEKASFTKDGAIYKDYCNCGEQAGETVVIKALMSAALDETWFFYDGSAKTPSVVVTDGEGNALVSDKDFTVSYNNNTEAGKATATVNVNNAYYEGSKDLDFAISKIKLDKSTYHVGDEIKVTAIGTNDADWVGLYKKNDKVDDPNLHNGGVVSIFWYYVLNAEKGTDRSNIAYVINQDANKQTDRLDTDFSKPLPAGEYKVVLLASDGYTAIGDPVYFTIKGHEYNTTKVTKATFGKDGKIEKLCSCGEASSDVTVIKAIDTIALEKDYFVFEDKAVTPAVVIKDVDGNDINANYTIDYKDNDKIGVATATVTFDDDKYEGTKELKFTIASNHTCDFKEVATPTIKSGKYQNGIVVKWSVVAGATGYNVYRKDMTTEGADWEKIATTVGKSYIDTKLTSGNAYSYKVEAYFRGFNSASKETKAVVYLSIPTATTYNAAKGITVEWDAQDGATRYHVFRRDYINGAWSEWVRVRTTETTSFVDAKAISGTRYQYKVYSATETDKSIASAIVLELRLATTTVKASNASGNAKITWSKVKGTTTYDVMRRTYTNGKWSAWKVVKNTSSLSYIDKSVKSGTKYQYKVVAKNGTKYVGAQSAAVTNLYLAASASIKATVAANGYKLTWSKVTGAASYNVYRSVYKNGKWTSWTKIANTKSLSYTDKNLTSGTNCKYKVVAVNGTYTSAGKGTANMRFVAPTAKVTATGTSKGFNVSWSKVAGAKGYYVYRREYKNGAWSAWTRIKTVNSGSTVKLTDTKNVKNVKYQYSVKAFSGSFTSALTISSVAKR